MKPTSCALAAAIILTGIAYAATPATKPAATTPATTTATASKPAPPQVLADTFLHAFPGSAASLAGRPDARSLHLEGRVRETCEVTLPAGGTETHIILVGSSQPDEAPAHFTCHFTTPPDQVADDKIIRLVGTVGPVTAAGDRVDLYNCHDLTVVGDPTVGNRLIGSWRSTSVILDGVALRKEAVAQGKKADNIPPADFVSPLHMELAIKADSTFAAELWDGDTLVRKVAGKCTLTKDGADTAKARIEGGGTPAAELDISFENDHLKIPLPGFADKHIASATAFEKAPGIPQKVDPKIVKAQALAWFKTNTKLSQQNADSILTTMSNGIDANAARKNWFVQSMGSDLLRRGKAAVLMTLYGKLTVLEFNDAQTQNDSPRKQTNNYGAIGGAVLMSPEVKIENLAFDQKGTVNVSRPLSGKITVRGLRKSLPEQYVLMIQLQDHNLYWTFQKPISADSQTYDFSFPPIGPSLPANAGATIPMILSVARNSTTAGTPAAIEVISEPIISLVDVAGK